MLWAVAVAAAAAGMVLRFVAPSPMWLDEALSVNIASLSISDGLEALRHDGHPLLYYALLGVWLDLWGDSDFAARSLSGLFSLGAAAVIWAATRRRLGTRAARYAAVLALTSPFLIRYGSEARMYALAALLTAAVWLLTEMAVARRSLGRLVALAALLAAGLHTHYWMIWPAAAASVVLAVRWLRAPEARAALTPVLAAYAGGWVGFAPWMAVLIDQAVHTGTPWAKWARPAEVAVETMEALGGGNRFEPVLLGVALAGAALLGTTLVGTGDDGVELGWPGRHRGAPLAAVATLTLAGGGLVAMILGSAFEARYAAVVVPLVLALAGRGLAGLPRWLAPAALAALAVFGVAVSVDEARRDRSQGQQVADTLDAQARPGDVVVACPDQLAPAVLRYLDTRLTVLTHPPTSDPRFVDWYDYSERIAAASPGDTAAAAADTAGRRGAIWLVTAPGYRGFETDCARLAAKLRQDRSAEQTVSARTAHEQMVLIRHPVVEP